MLCVLGISQHFLDCLVVTGSEHSETHCNTTSFSGNSIIVKELLTQSIHDTYSEFNIRKVVLSSAVASPATPKPKAAPCCTTSSLLGSCNCSTKYCVTDCP